MGIVDEFLSQTNQLIDERLKINYCLDKNESHQNFLLDVCSHLCSLKNAKRARPLLCCYYSMMINNSLKKDLEKIACAAEFIHNASLLHDDVIDEAEKRRGIVSANKKYGNNASILAGNFLLTEAFRLLKPLNRSLIDEAINVVSQMNIGAIDEINARGKVDITVQSWRSIAHKKTGVLFAWCGFAVGVINDNEKLSNLFFSLGEHIGYIFQMADDLKDFDGDKNLKDPLKDIMNKEPSLPIIIAINKNKTFKKEVAQCFSQNIVDKSLMQSLKEKIIISGAVDETKQLMQDELNILMNKLERFDGTVGKKHLDFWVQNLLSTVVK